MKALDRLRILESNLGVADRNYSISYTYDEKNRITRQETSGGLDLTVDYVYDSEDNIIQETQTYPDKVFTKTYSYEDGQIVRVDVEVK